MDKKEIIKLYKKGYSIDYITKKYYLFKKHELNKIKLNKTYSFGLIKMYNMSFCREIVEGVLIKYKYDTILNKER